MANSHYLEDMGTNLARGLIKGASVRNIFGTTGGTANIVTGSFRTPWEVAGDYVFPSSALVMTVTSDIGTTADDGVVVLIQGLDADYNEISDIVTINNATPPTTTAFFRINDAIITSGNATGNISITNGGVTYSKIIAGTGRDQKAVYTVPAGHSLLLTRIDSFCTDANGGKAAQFRNFLESSNGRQLRVADTTFFEKMNILRVAPFKYDEKTDIKMQLRSLSGSTFGSVFAEGILVNEDLI